MPAIFFLYMWYGHDPRRVDTVAEGRVCSLNGEIPEEGGVGLDTVPLLVIIGQVEEFPGQVCPHGSNGLAVQQSHVYYLIL